MGNTVVHVVEVEVTFRIPVKLAGNEHMDASRALEMQLLVNLGLIEEMFGPVLKALREDLGVDWRDPGVFRVVCHRAYVAPPETAPVAMELETDYEPRKKAT